MADKPVQDSKEVTEVNGNLSGDQLAIYSGEVSPHKPVSESENEEDLNGPGNRRFSYGEALDNHDLDTMYGDSVPDNVKPRRDMTRDGRRASARLQRLDSMKVLLPYRRSGRRRGTSPIDSSGLFSSILLTWMTPLFRKSYNGQGLKETDLVHLRSYKETAQSAAIRLEELWTDEVREKGPEDASLGRVMMRHLRTRLIAGGIVIFIALGSNFLLNPYLFYCLITHLNQPEPVVRYALCLALGMTLSYLVRAFGVHFGWYLSVRTAGRLRSAVLMLIYTKISRLRSTAELSVGEIVNIVVNDCTRIFEACHMSAMFVTIPALTILLFIGCLVLVGASALIGIVTILAFFFFQIVIAKLTARYRQAGVAFTDKRVRLMNELLTCVKLIKMYAWEVPFTRTIEGIRNSEARVLKRSGYLQALLISVAFLVAPAATLATIVAHTLIGYSISAAQAFTLMCLYMGMTVCLYMMPSAIKPIVESKIGIQRIKALLMLKETDDKVESPEDPDIAIKITDATLSWVDPESFQNSTSSVGNGGHAERQYRPDGNSANNAHGGLHYSTSHERDNLQQVDRLLRDSDVNNPMTYPLRNINFTVQKGKLIGICGSIGSGKSSLLSAILNQMYTVNGKIERAGTIAYASQQAWIMNATVKHNIVFNQPFDSKRYRKAVFACSLQPDFKIMTHGDRTEIGERGINLSGGQKQRISLARVLYSNRDIYLLDDPLSAVDAHVGQHIFTHCIKDAMKGKTVIFVTHQLQVNPNCMRNKTLEPPVVNFDSFMKSPDKPVHPCLRDCTNSAPMQCEYTFVVEWYYTMAKACYDCPCNLDDCQREHCVAADGVPRPIIVANRTLPGPAIEVCEGDEVIVNTINHMDNGEAITLHWHGLYQKSNQYMDGVFMITQCPITSQNNFRYSFIADHPGTHFWHAHTGMHRADGLFGAMIIRQSSEVNHHVLSYDYDLPEHKVVITDWLHEGNVNAYLASHFRGADDEPMSILINGKGAFAVYGGDGSTSSITPREVFEVQQGKRYRFRVISSAAANIPVKVSVDGHNITLISGDGDDFEPLEVDAFFLFGGERYDFILNASQDIGNYWLKVKGYKQGTGLQGLAIIRYEDAPNEIPETDPSVDRRGNVFQDLRQTSYQDEDAVTTVNELRSLKSMATSNQTLRRVYLPLDLHSINNPMFNDPELYPLGPEGPGWGDFLMPQINRRTFQVMDFPLLSQFDDELAEDGAYAKNICEVDQSGYENCDTDFCSCTQYIKVDLGQPLEIVLIDESTSPFEVEHPFHLHGHAFRILAQGRLGLDTTKEEVIQLDKNGGIVRNYDHPPEKDTVVVPNGGYTVIEFVADNPGWWFLHCHMEFHLEDGMGILIRVGDQSDLPPVPEGFPRCGDYPPISSESSLPPSESTSNISAIVIILIVVIVLLALMIAILLAVIVCRGRSADDGKGHPQQIQMNDR